MVEVTRASGNSKSKPSPLGVGGSVLLGSTGLDDCWVGRAFVRKGLGALAGRDDCGGVPGLKENAIGINLGDSGDGGDRAFVFCGFEGMDACGAMVSRDCGGAWDIRRPICTVADETTDESRRWPK